MNIKSILIVTFNSVAIIIYLVFIFLVLTFMELVFWFEPVRLTFWACKFQETTKIFYTFENTKKQLNFLYF